MSSLRSLLPELRSSSGLAVAVVVDNRSELDLEPTSRLIVRANGSTVGHIHPLLDRTLAQEGLARLEHREVGLVSYRVTERGLEPVGRQGGQLDVYFEILALPPRLVIVGAGHIALPLARMAKLLEFHVTIVDDRPDLASRERFPDADEILIGEYRETVASLALDRDSAIVLVTRGHVHDQACLEEVLPGTVGHIGMIGSKRRVRTVLAHARENGADPVRLARVHAPIGLDINARTPAEIAVAIMAEIINIKRGGSARSLKLKERTHA